MRTYTVKADDFLLGVRLPRKRATDIIFAAIVAAGMFRTRDQIAATLDYDGQGPVIEVELPTGVLIVAERTQ